MKKVLRGLLVVEFCLIVLCTYLIFKPRYSLEDIKVESFRDQIVINTKPAIKNYYILKSLDNLYNDIQEEIAELKSKFITYHKDGESLDREIRNYVTIQDVIVNDTDLSGFDIELNYLKRQKKSEDIKLVSTFDTDTYTNDTIDYYKEFNENMKRPSARMVNGVMEILDEGKSGRELDEEGLRSGIQEALVDYESKGSCLGELTVAYKDIDVVPTLESIRQITSRVSTFSTGYSSSGASRKTNIAVATNNINGTLVAPGETVSVDKMIKSRVAANGYQKAGSYQNGRTVQTYGGGVCQVSSTLYGACLRAGLVPVERNAHSMAVSYVPLGLDAAISEGVKDLKIKNTYDSPIYITGSANGATVTFNIYGKEGLLEGYSYQPASSSGRNGLWATSWLNKSKDGAVVEKINLFDSSYRPHG